jgi:hypothetical protein
MSLSEKWGEFKGSNDKELGLPCETCSLFLKTILENPPERIKVLKLRQDTAQHQNTIKYGTISSADS